MENGYIKLYRQLLESPIFLNDKLLKLWIWCLLKASHKPHKVIVGVQEIELNSGQFICGRKKDSEALGLSESTFYRYLKRLESLKMLSLNSNNKYTVVTVENWAKFQEEEREANNKRTTNEQQVNTYKNGKNGKNNNNKYKRERIIYKYIYKGRDETPLSPYGTRNNVLLTEAEYKSITDTYEQSKKLIDKVSRYLANAEKTYQDHFALIEKIAEEDKWAKKAKVEVSEVKETKENVPMPEELRKKLNKALRH